MRFLEISALLNLQLLTIMNPSAPKALLAPRDSPQITPKRIADLNLHTEDDDDGHEQDSADEDPVVAIDDEESSAQRTSSPPSWSTVRMPRSQSYPSQAQSSPSNSPVKASSIRPKSLAVFDFDEHSGPKRSKIDISLALSKPTAPKIMSSDEEETFASHSIFYTTV